MLVLTRKVSQRIRVELPGGEFGWITMVEVDRGKVRVGLEFPMSVGFTREELLPAGEQHFSNNFTTLGADNGTQRSGEASREAAN